MWRHRPRCCPSPALPCDARARSPRHVLALCPSSVRHVCVPPLCMQECTCPSCAIDIASARPLSARARACLVGSAYCLCVPLYCSCSFPVPVPLLFVYRAYLPRFYRTVHTCMVAHHPYDACVSASLSAVRVLSHIGIYRPFRKAF